MSATTWTLHHGDCRLWLPTLADRSVDSFITDPPYGDVTHEGARSVTSTRALVPFASITSEELRAILVECGRIARRWFVATMEWRHIADFEREPPAGWRFVRFGVWVKPNGAPQFTGDRPGTGWEGVIVLHRDDAPLRWNGGGHHGVWTVPKISGPHPTQKPLPLLRQFIRQFTDAGETIGDPFCGSGQTGVAALLEGRHFLGAEMDPGYAAVARERLARTQPEGSAAIPLFDLAATP